MTTTRFFVYGSLSEGMVHFTKIKDFIVSSVPASVQATAYRLKIGYPALVNQQSHQIYGQLLELNASDILIALLDEFFGFNRLMPEKSIYSRDSVPVTVAETGEVVQAFVYFMNPKKLPADAKLIDDGNWLGSLQEKPALPSQLSERQVTYIKKLGKSTGREIVPIDLPLYRELMNLELIVDKGRRLALSKLGQEVYRHLE